MISKKRIPRRKLEKAALESFQDVLETQAEFPSALFAWEMSQHPELIEAWQDEAMPDIIEAADGKTMDAQKAGLRSLLMRLVREREVALQFIFEFDTPEEVPVTLRDDDEREVLVRAIYRSQYRLGGVDEYARQWGHMAIMHDASIYVARDISGGLFGDADIDDWFGYYTDAVSRMVFHRNEAALAAEDGKEYLQEKLVRAYEKLLDQAEKDIAGLEQFSFSRIDFERSVLEKKGRHTPGLDDDDSRHEGRPSIYLG